MSWRNVSTQRLTAKIRTDPPRRPFTTRARDDLQKLALDIAAAQREGQPAVAVQTLYRRFQALQASTKTHSDLLSSSLEDTTQAMHTVQAQLVSLLAQAGDTDD